MGSSFIRGGPKGRLEEMVGLASILENRLTRDLISVTTSKQLRGFLLPFKLEATKRVGSSCINCKRAQVATDPAFTFWTFLLMPGNL